MNTITDGRRGGEDLDAVVWVGERKRQLRREFPHASTAGVSAHLVACQHAHSPGRCMPMWLTPLRQRLDGS
jgi:hypothetical protein